MLELDKNYPEELVKDPVVEAKIREAERTADDILEKAKAEGVKIMDKARAEADRLRKKHPGREGMEMATAHTEQQASKVKQMLEEAYNKAQKCITDVVESEEHRRAVEINIQVTTEKLNSLLTMYVNEYDSLQNVEGSEKKQIRALKRIKFYTKLKEFIFNLQDVLKEVRIMQESFALVGDMTTTINNLLKLDTQFNEKTAQQTMKMLRMHIRKMEKAIDRTIEGMDAMFDEPKPNIFVQFWNWITRRKAETDQEKLEKLKGDKETGDMLSIARASAQNSGSNGATGGAPSGVVGGNTTFSGTSSIG